MRNLDTTFGFFCSKLYSKYNFLQALGECAPNVRPWVLNVINESTKLDEPAHVYLLEDALELWLAIIETSPTADPALLQLAHNLHPIIGECYVANIASVKQSQIWLLSKWYL